jgi:hypothetical protein
MPATVADEEGLADLWFEEVEVFASVKSRAFGAGSEAGVSARKTPTRSIAL